MKKKMKNKTIQNKDDLCEQFMDNAVDFFTTTNSPTVEKNNDEPDHFVEKHNSKVAEFKFKVNLVFSSVLSVFFGIHLYFNENCGIIATLIITYFFFGLMFICMKERLK